MESHELRELIHECPLLIRMNDGREYFVEKPEFIIVGDNTAGVLVNVEGVMRNSVLSLINIASAVPNATASQH